MKKNAIARVIEIMGGLALGFVCLMPFLGSAIPADSNAHHVHRNLLNDQRPHTSSEVVDDVAVSASAESNLRYKIELLQRGIRFLLSVPDYTAKLQKQEVVHGTLLDEQEVSIKCRHKPFSVYLLWISGEAGREVIYVDGKNNGNMIAHDGGWKSRIPAFSLSAEGRLAMRDTRYPVTTAGLLGLIKTMVNVHTEDLNRSNITSCEIDPDQRFEGRPCSMFTTIYKSAKLSPNYRKSITWIDREWNVALQTRHFEWPRAGTDLPEDELDRATLMESYSFTEITLRCGLTDLDFDRSNPEYQFH